MVVTFLLDVRFYDWSEKPGSIRHILTLHSVLTEKDVRGLFVGYGACVFSGLPLSTIQSTLEAILY